MLGEYGIYCNARLNRVLMKLNMEDKTSVCSNTHIEAAATKTDRVEHIVRWLQKRSH